MKTLRINTAKPKEVIDITEVVRRELKALGTTDGVCHLFVKHTTAALTTADLDPGTDVDMLDAFREMIPRLRYRHPHDPSHVADHILSSLIGPSLAVPVEGGELSLGTWQRIVLLEFDGPRARELVMALVAES
jgi:secondary thiamine-phosphate synthase enzyme